MGLDLRAVFARTLHEMIVEVFAAHGIDAIYEDELDAIVRECTRRCYAPILAECRALGLVDPPAGPPRRQRRHGAATLRTRRK